MRVYAFKQRKRVLIEDYIEVIQSKVQQDGDCLLWTGGVLKRTGSPILKVFNSIQPVARVQYKLYKGAIPPKYIVKHTCKNKLCVNPEHLVAVPKHKEKSIDDWFTPCTDIREVWKKMGLIPG